MKLKHKLIKEFQYLGDDKKIIVLKVGTILEEYIYKLKSELIPIDKDIVDSNPDFFEIVEWKAELLSYLKSNKIPQPAILSKKLYPFMEEFIVSNQSKTETIQVDKVVEKIVEVEKIVKVSDDSRFDELIEKEKKLILNEDDVDKRLKRVQKREDELKESIKQLDDKEEDVLSKLKEITDKEAKLCKDLEDLHSLESKLNALKEDLDKREDIVTKRESLVDELEETIKEYDIRFNELEQSNNSLKTENDFLKTRRY